MNNSIETGDMRFIYQVDPDGRFMSVSDNWDDFARANKGDHLTSDKVLGTLMWDHITGKETRELYRVLADRARATDQGVRFPFRCDAPDKRRYMEMILIFTGGNVFEYRSTILRVEEREPQALLDAGAPRLEEFVNVCSWCKKVQSNDHWVEVEDAIRELGLMDSPNMPQLSHGVCPTCFESLMGEAC